jgi:hypothetical protein
VYPDPIDEVGVLEKQAIDQVPQDPIPPHGLDVYLAAVDLVIDPDESNPEGGQPGRFLGPVLHAIAGGDGRVGEILVMTGASGTTRFSGSGVIHIFLLSGVVLKSEKLGRDILE